VVQKYVERYHVVERRDGLSFVGDLSVHEYLGTQADEAPESLEEVPEESEQVETD